jgi:ABC-type nitrate/sulfonate/bicarbonate transport system substrate-binding protein
VLEWRQNTFLPNWFLDCAVGIFGPFDVGSKDQVIVANFINEAGGAICAKPDIKTAEDLRGKTIGVGRAGSISDSVMRYVLRAKLGLVPDRDVKLSV